MNAMSRTLTLATLEKEGACGGQVALFRKMFGESVDITEALCAEHAAAFQWSWAADNLLSPQARAAYDAAVAQARTAYDAAVAPAWAAFREARAQAWAALREARAPAWATYQSATAQAWARAYIGDAK